MARYAMAMEIGSWREGQRKGRRRKGGKGRKGRKGPRQQGARPREERPSQHTSPRRPARDEDPPEIWDTAPEPDEEPPPDGEDLGGERRRRVPGRRREGADRSDWQTPQALGAGMRIQTRRGLRAAVVEVKPGLFVVAEVPSESVEFGFGPMLLAPALIKTLGRALQGPRSAGGAGRAHRPELSAQAPRQLPGPVAEEPATEGRLAPWLDDDIAAEIGCPCRRPPKRRAP